MGDDTYSWTGGSGSFSDPAMWTDLTNPPNTGVTFPGAGDTAIFSTGGDVSDGGDVDTLIIDADTSFGAEIGANTLSIAAGATLTAAGFDFGAGNVDIEGALLSNLTGYLLGAATLGSNGSISLSGSGNNPPDFGVLGSLGSAGQISGSFRLLDSGDIELSGAQASLTTTGTGDAGIVVVGVAGAGYSTATLDVSNQASIVSTEAVIGAQIEPGLAIVDAAQWTNSTFVLVGGDNMGTLLVENAGTFDATELDISAAGIGGFATLQDAGSFVQALQGLEVGLGGTLLITGGASLTTSGLDVIGSLVSNPTVTSDPIVQITDGGIWRSQQQIILQGPGTLMLQGGTLLSTSVDIAEFAGAVASASGAGSEWTNSGTMTVGDGSAGTLTLSDTASLDVGGDLIAALGTASTGTITIDSASLHVGGNVTLAATGTAQLTLSGTGSIDVDGTVTVGEAGTGTLSVQATGTATMAALIVAARAGGGSDDAPSLLTVDGSGSVLMVAEDATIGSATAEATNDSGQTNGMCGDWSYGDSGVGQIIAADSGSISIAGTLTLQAPNDDDAPATVSIVNGGAIEVGGKGRAQSDQFVVDAAGLVIGHGTIAADVGATGKPAGAILNDGTVEAAQGTLELDADLTGGGSYTIDANSLLDVNGTVDDSVTVSVGSFSTLMIDQAKAFAGTIANFGSGDIIDLSNVSGLANSQYISATFLAGTLNIRDVGSFTITGPSLEAVPTFAFANDGNGGTDIGTVPLWTLLNLSFDTYNTPAGYQNYQVYMTAQPDAGFYAVAYDDPNSCDGNIVIAFRGTDLDLPAIQSGNVAAIMTALKNFLADSAFPFADSNALLTRYVADAAAFTAKVVAAARAQFTAPLITLTGHSLGGALAQMVGEAGSFAVAAFDAPGSGDLYGSFTSQLGSVVGLGAGGTNINYRVSGDQVSAAGTPIGQTVTLQSPYTSDNASLADIIANFLNNHGVGNGGFQTAFQSLNNPSAYESGFAGPNDLSLLEDGVQSPAGNQIVFAFEVGALAANAIDPTGGSAFTFSETASSPSFASIDLPFIPGIASYDVAVETGGAFSAFATVDPGIVDMLPAGANAIEFVPLDTASDQTTISGSFDFTLGFAGSGEFNGTLTESGAVALAQPVVTPDSVVVEPGGSATPLGIATPTDAAFSDLSYLAVMATGLPSNGTVELAGGSTAVTLDEVLTPAELAGLTFVADPDMPGAVSSFDYTVTDADFAMVQGSAAIQIACFVAGTRIMTTAGEVPVQELRLGDRVVLARDRRSTRPVVWLGHRALDCERHPRPHEVLPVRVCAGALAPGRPMRDLLLSPDHAVFAGGVLVPVRLLLNGATIVQEPAAGVAYWHVELDRHDALYAEGLACESYLDTGNRAAFANGGAAAQLHADFALRIWQRDAFAPLVLEGPHLARLRARLLRRAASLGHRHTRDPGLRLLANGRAVRLKREGPIWRVVIPPGTDCVRVLSRAFVPAHMRPGEDDPRRLGIAVGGLWLDGRRVALDSPGLAAGWHAPEYGWRWTDGDAEINPAGARTLGFEIAMAGTYWCEEVRHPRRAA